MVVEEVANLSVGLISELGQIALWLQALGVIVVLWIIFQAASLWFEARRFRQVLEIREDMKRIESKIDELNKKK